MLVPLACVLSASAESPSPREVEEKANQAEVAPSAASTEHDDGHPSATNVLTVGGKMSKAESAKRDQGDPYIDTQRQLVAANNRLVWATCGLILVGLGEVVLYFLALRPTNKAVSAAKESADALINKIGLGFLWK